MATSSAAYATSKEATVPSLLTPAAAGEDDDESLLLVLVVVVLPKFRTAIPALDNT